MSCELLNFRMATSELLLEKGYLFLRKVPTPNRSDYKDYSAKFEQSVGGQARHGYKNVTILWTNLDAYQTYQVKNMLNTVLAGNEIVYLTIDRNNGDSMSYDWIDVSGYPHQIDPEEDGDLVGSQGRAFRNIQLFVNNLTIINDPSTVV